MFPILNCMLSFDLIVWRCNNFPCDDILSKKKALYRFRDGKLVLLLIFLIMILYFGPVPYHNYWTWGLVRKERLKHIDDGI